MNTKTKETRIGTCDECFSVTTITIPVRAYNTGYCKPCYFAIFDAPIEIIRY